MAEVREKRVLSSDGEHELVGTVYLPDGAPKAFFHVVHGMKEYIGRYDGFLKTMAEKGYLAFGYDHLGHGRTAKDASELGYIAPKDGWLRLVDDVAAFGNAMKNEYPSPLPYYLMGHSMGSFVVRLAVTEYPRLATKLIIMGTGGPNPIARLGSGVVSAVKTFRGEKHVSALLDNLSFGQYNERFPNEGSVAWLTKDPEVRERYLKDPFCSYSFTASAMGDLIRLTRECNRPEWSNQVGDSLPILLLSGEEDPVGEYGAGVRTVFERLKEAGKNAEMILYPGCRHEILNDTSREQVIADIVRFLEQNND
ncbi:MAG: lysophospholipase, partial [Clostridia bacterium]|nr:lysophospholipase [Clostridia bacterium]